MGWNDHVEFWETECQDCGEVDTWEYWNEVAMARYGGANKHLGNFLGHDDNKANRCPHCGSTKGVIVEDDDD
jgi:Zn finger protein HypA/HybF involved in hydrogenase expression